MAEQSDRDKDLPKAPPGVKCIICGSSENIGGRVRAQRKDYPDDINTFYICKRVGHGVAPCCDKLFDCPPDVINVPGDAPGTWQWLEITSVVPTLPNES
jgi:hypothetical protein